MTRRPRPFAVRRSSTSLAGALHGCRGHSLAATLLAAAALTAQGNPPVHRNLGAPAIGAAEITAMTVVPNGVLLAGHDGSLATLWRLDPATGVAVATRFGAPPLAGRLTAVARDGARVAGRSGGVSFWADPTLPATAHPIAGVTTVRGVRALGAGAHACGSANTKAVTWTTTGGVLPLLDRNGLVVFAAAAAMSASGAVIVGNDANIADAVWWLATPAGAYGNARTLPPQLLDAADGVSPDGRVLVGTSGNFGASIPTVWWADHGHHALRLLEDSAGVALSAGTLRAATDAGVCVGEATQNGVTRGIVWRADSGDVRIEWFDAFAAARGLTLPFVAAGVRAVADDGTDLHFVCVDASATPHYVRTPRTPSQPAPFRVYGAGSGALDATPALAGVVVSGGGAAGGSVRFDARRHRAHAAVPIGWFGLALGSASPAAAPLLLEPAQLLGLVDVALLPSGGGLTHASLPCAIPAFAAGHTFHVQFAGFADTGALVFSNGLRFLVP
jgi:hypothetical protein